MKIGIGVPALGFQGGIERHAHDLARALKRRGHGITLLHGPAAGRDAGDYAAIFDDVRPMARALASADLDVVYVHKATGVDELASLGSKPIAIAAHDHDLTCVRRHRYVPLGRTPCHRAPGMMCIAQGCAVVRDRSPDAPFPIRLKSPFALRSRLHALSLRGQIVACSEYVARGLVRAGVDPARVRVIHPVPPESDAPLVPRPRAPRLLCVGQLVRGKGFDLAIDALLHLNGDVTLDVAGDGPERASLESQANRVANGRVRFIGYVAPEAVEGLYDAASVVLVPSRWPEPFGMVGIEAMRRARPVVAVAHGGIPEWQTTGRGGRLVTPGSASSLANGARALLGDEGAGLDALAHARARFTHASAVSAVEGMLVELAKT